MFRKFEGKMFKFILLFNQLILKLFNKLLEIIYFFSKKYIINIYIDKKFDFIKNNNIIYKQLLYVHKNCI